MYVTLFLTPAMLPQSVGYVCLRTDQVATLREYLRNRARVADNSVDCVPGGADAINAGLSLTFIIYRFLF